MKPSLLTWNSVNINNASPLTSIIPPGQMANLSSNPVTVPRANDFPFLSDTVLVPHVFVIEVYIASGQNINTNREIMKGYFNVMDKTRHTLVIQDTNDGNRQYYLTGFPTRVVSQGNDKPNAFSVTFQVEYPYWQLVTTSSDSWDITVSGDSDVVSNIGNISVPPIFVITPTTTKTAGLKYSRYVPIYNNLDNSYVAPLEITNGGLDVQSLIDANKMQAGGNDFRIWEDGAFQDRWLSGMDSDSDPALCWVNFELNARKEGTTLSTFDSDDTTLIFSQTRANLTFLQSLKMVSNYTLLIDSEAIVFNPDNIDFINYQITSIVREQKGTTAASHSASSTVRFIEHDLFILYGDSDLGAPDIDDNYKPIFDLTSTNLAWSYTNFFDADSFRTGMWQGEVLNSRTGLSYVFTDSDNAFIDPSAVLGLGLIGSADFTVMNESGTISWMITHPAGITNALYSGSKYNTGSWPAIAGLQYLQPNAVWFTKQNETAPSVAQSWDDFGPTNVSLGNTYNSIRFAFDGILSSVINEQALLFFHTVTLSFDSDNVPTISVGGENNINFFDFKLTNNTTGEYIKVTTPCVLNTPLTIDCINKIAYLNDGTRVNVTLSSDRDDWLNLAAGNNSLQYDDTGTAAVNIVIQHRDRIL